MDSPEIPFSQCCIDIDHILQAMITNESNQTVLELYGKYVPFSEDAFIISNDILLLENL